MGLAKLMNRRYQRAAAGDFAGGRACAGGNGCSVFPCRRRQNRGSARVPEWRRSNIQIRPAKVPETAFVAFPDCAHAEFVAGQPEAFAARLAETLELDGSDI